MLKDILGHEDIKSSLKTLKNKLPTVLLFTGPKGVGKKHTALNLLDEIYKGSFNSRLESHPDILVLEPETKTFKLELIDQMKDYISDTAFELDSKYVILRDVDLMNKESANACLKVFEDAPDNTYFILLAENKELVINTICSRSISFEFSPIKDLKRYMPNLSDTEVKMMGGCLGNKATLDNLGVDEIYQEIHLFVSTFADLDYSNIIDWYLSHKDLDIILLNNMLLLVSQDLAKKNKSLNTSLIFLDSCNKFKDKLNSNLKLDMHFKNMLIQNKHLLIKNMETP